MKKKLMFVLLLFCFSILIITTAFAAASDHTAEDAISWAKGKVGTPVGFDDGSGYYQCTEFIQGYCAYLGVNIQLVNAENYSNSAYWPSEWLVIAGGTPQKGDILVYSKYSSTVQPYGHVAIYESDNSIYDQNGSVYGATVKHETANYKTYTYNYWGCVHPNFRSSYQGSEMSQGYDRVLPDGDYLIVTTATTNKDYFYYLDIEGTEVPAPNERNVSLCGPSTNPAECEVWTLEYNNSDKFYTIYQKNSAQKGRKMCLDVYGASHDNEANVWVCQSNNSNAQKWAIKRNASNNGYQLQPKCSGGGNDAMCLDIQNGSITNGANVRQYVINNTNAQSWLFIPYKPVQPIENGRYILLYDADKTYELDVPGDTGDVGDVQVELWTNNAPSQFNSFDFTKLDNGYYKVKHVASGKCLEVKEGSSSFGSVVRLFADNGVLTQQWAVIPNGTGYSLIARSNGYALDLPGGVTGKGKPLESFPQMSNNNQRWSFVKAEYSITFLANGAESGVPATMTKYYNKEITIPNQTPVRDGYQFIYWVDQSSTSDQLIRYYPGDSITVDADTELMAEWESVVVDYAITFDANGGTNPPALIHATTRSITLPIATPTRRHYDFMGWSTSATGAAVYARGATYTGTQSVTLYAAWEHGTNGTLELPAALTEIESEAFLGSSADIVVIPKTIETIGANAFDDVIIKGYSATAAETYAQQNNLTFIDLTEPEPVPEPVPVPPKYTFTFENYEKFYELGSNFAHFGTKIYGGAVNLATHVGCELYNAAHGLLGSCQDGAYLEGNCLIHHYTFKAGSSDINITLSSGTDYCFRYFVVIDGDKYYSDYINFRTN